MTIDKKGRITPRLAKKQTMTTFHINMKATLEDLQRTKTENKMDASPDRFTTKAKKEVNPELINSYEEATANIANAVEIRDMKHDRAYL